MSIQIVNAFESAITVVCAGRTYTLPNGFTGSLSLSGACTVQGGGQTYQVTVPTYTNWTCSSFQFVNETGDVARIMVGTNGAVLSAPIDASYGTNLFIEFGIGSGNLWSVGTLPIGSAGVVLTVTGHPENPPIPFAFSYAGTTFRDSSGTNVITTNTSSTPLGTFTAGTGVRTVEVHAAGLVVTDFQTEAVAVGAGFILAVTIACFRYVLRVIRGLTEQGGDL